MKKTMFAAVAAATVAATSAVAADLPRSQPYYSSPAVPAGYNWAGMYVGANVGYQWGRTTNSTTRPDGIEGGLQAGYNWQSGPWVFGVEGDIDASWIKGSGTCGGLTCETKNTWLGTVRGRLGYAIDRFMPYVTGGLAVGDIKNNISGIGSASDTKAGWTVGGGLEYAFNGPWSAKVEYLYVDLGRGGAIAGSDAKFQTNIVRAGLNYRF
jgi:outer membrane immunogenic protein